jgi:hypothetical protein
MATKIDLGKLSETETRNLMIECINNLTLDDVIEVLKLVFDNRDERAEIIAQLES